MPPTAPWILDLGLTPDEAMILATFLKRAGYSTYRTHAQGEHEAYVMFDAAEKFRRALACAGYDPR